MTAPPRNAAAGPPGPPAATAVVEAYFEAVDAEDFDKLSRLLDPDVSLTACGSRPRQGAAAVIALFRAIFERFPMHADRPRRLICEGGTVVAEFRFEGTSAAGVDVAFEAVDVFDIEDGRIVRLTQWFDSAHLERQLRSAGAPSRQPPASSGP
ncbi:MAG: nuclear transport factor 2 family protein [bacterium]|nr:nuclear transport factor 2 family protein [bacterium]